MASLAAAQPRRIASSWIRKLATTNRRSMSYSPPYTYIEADALADELRTRGEQPGKLAVVDVRGAWPPSSWVKLTLYR